MAKVEVAVQVIEGRILARLGQHAFHALAAGCCQRHLQRQPHSRRELFERLDRPAMQPLPAEPYVYAAWKYVKSGIDFNIGIDHRFYSVPHALVGHRLETRVCATTTVEVFHEGQ